MFIGRSIAVRRHEPGTIRESGDGWTRSRADQCGPGRQFEKDRGRSVERNVTSRATDLKILHLFNSTKFSRLGIESLVRALLHSRPLRKLYLTSPSPRRNNVIFSYQLLTEISNEFAIIRDVECARYESRAALWPTTDRILVISFMIT